ncbi:MAG: ABC transporter permease [Dehalococcoidales bacterium]|nr:ABC transporter permease [Dehalococcoidales bacterium]
MQRYILSRVAQSVLCIIAITMVVFMLIRLSGDPVAMMMPPEAKPEEYEIMRVYLGLDKPIYVQYWKYISGIFQGDFGTSIRFDEPCLSIWLEKFPNTLELSLAALLFAVSIGVPVGILSAVKVGTWFDQFGKIFSLLGQALPVFWLGLMLILIFGVYLRILPFSGMGGLPYLILPSITLGYFFNAAMARLTRSAMLDVLDTEYIKLARIKGVSENMVVLKHAFRNALIPIVTLGTMNFISMLNGTVVTETIFSWPGVGRLMVDSIYARDYPMVQTCLLLSSVFIVFGNLLVDILYVYIDPRIKYS